MFSGGVEYIEKSEASARTVAGFVIGFGAGLALAGILILLVML